MRASREQRLSEALFAVYDVVARTDEALEELLRDLRIRASAAHLLWAVDPDGPPPSMRQAAERVHCTPQNVTFLCRELEERGLARRAPSATDRRRRVIELTPRGREARAAVVALVTAHSPLARQDDETLDRIRALLLPGASTP